jgi:hypothetical protein
MDRSAPEIPEMLDVLDKLGNPAVTTLAQLRNKAGEEFRLWLDDRKNRRTIPHRFEKCGYIPVRNDDADDGLWKISGARQAVYGKLKLSVRDRLAAVSVLIRGSKA